MSSATLGTGASPPDRASFTRTGFALLLLLSGFCGISYEVLYARILSNFIGDQFAVSASILLTFMLGLGCGTLYAHRLWRWLWLVEGGIGAYGAAFALGAGPVEDWYYALEWLRNGLGGAMVVCFLLLLAPAFLIGCSLPLFAGYLANLTEGRVFAKAYMVYNCGAALTVLAVEFWLLRWLGVRHTVLAMASLNGLVSLSLLLGFGDLRDRRAAAKEPLVLPRRCWLALAVASVGSAVFQLLMVKLAECFLGPFRETFAIVLALILLGIAVGSALARARRFTFGGALMAALAGLVWLVAGYELVTRGYAWLHPVVVGGAVSDLALKVAALGLLMGVPATAFGATIPALLAEQGDVARDSGRLLCVSSLANAAGFLLMAMVLHRFLDYGVLLLVVTAIAALSVLVYTSARGWLPAGALALAGLAGGLHQDRWDENLLYVGYDAFVSTDDLADTRQRLVFAERFKSHQDVFSLNREGDEESFFINGYISFYLGLPAEKIVGALPCLFTPRTDQALVLGLGSGVTGGTVAQLFDHTDAVEINPAVLPNLHRMSRHNFDIASNPRVRFILDDGIHYTRVTPKRYTLIVNTVTSPRYFSSAKLYTRDFLETIRQRLTPDGLYVTWCDARIGGHGLEIILKTMEQSFRNCAVAGIRSGYFLLLCSQEPLRLRQPDLAARNPMLSHYFKLNGLPPAFLPYALLTTRGFELVANPNAPINTMDHPSLEFRIARLTDEQSTNFATRLIQTMRLEDVVAALQPPLEFNLLDMAWVTQYLYDTSDITSRRLALAEAQREDFREANRQARREQFAAWAAYANQAEVYHKQGTELLTQRRFDEAIEAERKALALDPNQDDAWSNIAAGYERLGQFQAAITNYLQERKMDPKDKRISFYLGRVYYKLQQYPLALAHLQQAVREDDRAENHLYLSVVLEAMGRRKEADQEYQRGLQFGITPAPRLADAAHR